MDINKIVEQCNKEEETYQFPSFTQTDALALGTLLYEKSKTCEKPVAIEIRINHLLVFCFYPNGTNKNNKLWLRAKANTVDMMHQSSLHFWSDIQLSGKTPESMRMPETKYACCGGGFPLIIRDTGMIGTICVSGLPHMTDHQLIIDTIKEYLRK